MIIDNIQEVTVQLNHETKTEKKKLEASDLYTVREIEALFRVSRRTITNWQCSGILKPIKIGNVLRYLRDDIEKLITAGKQCGIKGKTKND
jgi:hypothetical protein